MSPLLIQARIARISLTAAVVVGAIVCSSFLYLWWPANHAELFISVGTGLAAAIVLRRVVASELEKRHEGP